MLLGKESKSEIRDLSLPALEIKGRGKSSLSTYWVATNTVKFSFLFSRESLFRFISDYLILPEGKANFEYRSGADDACRMFDVTKGKWGEIVDQPDLPQSVRDICKLCSSFILRIYDLLFSDDRESKEFLNKYFKLIQRENTPENQSNLLLSLISTLLLGLFGTSERTALVPFSNVIMSHFTDFFKTLTQKGELISKSNLEALTRSISSILIVSEDIIDELILVYENLIKSKFTDENTNIPEVLYGLLAPLNEKKLGQFISAIEMVQEQIDSLNKEQKIKEINDVDSILKGVDQTIPESDRTFLSLSREQSVAKNFKFLTGESIDEEMEEAKSEILGCNLKEAITEFLRLINCYSEKNYSDQKPQSSPVLLLESAVKLSQYFTSKSNKIAIEKFKVILPRLFFHASWSKVLTRKYIDDLRPEFGEEAKFYDNSVQAFELLHDTGQKTHHLSSRFYDMLSQWLKNSTIFDIISYCNHPLKALQATIKELLDFAVANIPTGPINAIKGQGKNDNNLIPGDCLKLLRQVLEKIPNVFVSDEKKKQILVYFAEKILLQTRFSPSHCGDAVYHKLLSEIDSDILSKVTPKLKTSLKDLYKLNFSEVSSLRAKLAEDKDLTKKLNIYSALQNYPMVILEDSKFEETGTVNFNNEKNQFAKWLLLNGIKPIDIAGSCAEQIKYEVFTNLFNYCLHTLGVMSQDRAICVIQYAFRVLTNVNAELPEKGLLKKFLFKICRNLDFNKEKIELINAAVLLVDKDADPSVKEGISLVKNLTVFLEKFTNIKNPSEALLEEKLEQELRLTSQDLEKSDRRLFESVIGFLKNTRTFRYALSQEETKLEASPPHIHHFNSWSKDKKFDGVLGNVKQYAEKELEFILTYCLDLLNGPIEQADKLADRLKFALGMVIELYQRDFTCWHQWCSDHTNLKHFCFNLLKNHTQHTEIIFSVLSTLKEKMPLTGKTICNDLEQSIFLQTLQDCNSFQSIDDYLAYIIYLDFDDILETQNFLSNFRLLIDQTYSASDKSKFILNVCSKISNILPFEKAHKFKLLYEESFQKAFNTLITPSPQNYRTADCSFLRESEYKIVEVKEETDAKRIHLELNDANNYLFIKIENNNKAIIYRQDSRGVLCRAETNFKLDRNMTLTASDEKFIRQYYQTQAISAAMQAFGYSQPRLDPTLNCTKNNVQKDCLIAIYKEIDSMIKESKGHPLNVVLKDFRKKLVNINISFGSKKISSQFKKAEILSDNIVKRDIILLWLNELTNYIHQLDKSSQEYRDMCEIYKNLISTCKSSGLFSETHSLILQSLRNQFQATSIKQLESVQLLNFEKIKNIDLSEQYNKMEIPCSAFYDETYCPFNYSSSEQSLITEGYKSILICLSQFNVKSTLSDLIEILNNINEWFANLSKIHPEIIADKIPLSLIDANGISKLSNIKLCNEGFNIVELENVYNLLSSTPLLDNCAVMSSILFSKFETFFQIVKHVPGSEPALPSMDSKHERLTSDQTPEYVINFRKEFCIIENFNFHLNELLNKLDASDLRTNLKLLYDNLNEFSQQFDIIFYSKTQNKSIYQSLFTYEFLVMKGNSRELVSFEKLAKENPNEIFHSFVSLFFENNLAHPFLKINIQNVSVEPEIQSLPSPENHQSFLKYTEMFDLGIQPKLEVTFDKLTLEQLKIKLHNFPKRPIEIKRQILKQYILTNIDEIKISETIDAIHDILDIKSNNPIFVKCFFEEMLDDDKTREAIVNFIGDNLDDSFGRYVLFKRENFDSAEFKKIKIDDFGNSQEVLEITSHFLMLDFDNESACRSYFQSALNKIRMLLGSNTIQDGAKILINQIANNFLGMVKILPESQQIMAHRYAVMFSLTNVDLLYPKETQNLPDSIKPKESPYQKLLNILKLIRQKKSFHPNKKQYQDLEHELLSNYLKYQAILTPSLFVDYATTRDEIISRQLIIDIMKSVNDFDSDLSSQIVDLINPFSCQDTQDIPSCFKSVVTKQSEIYNRKSDDYASLLTDFDVVLNLPANKIDSVTLDIGNYYLEDVNQPYFSKLNKSVQEIIVKNLLENNDLIAKVSQNRQQLLNLFRLIKIIYITPVSIEIINLVFQLGEQLSKTLSDECIFLYVKTTKTFPKLSPNKIVRLLEWLRADNSLSSEIIINFFKWEHYSALSLIHRFKCINIIAKADIKLLRNIFNFSGVVDGLFNDNKKIFIQQILPELSKQQQEIYINKLLSPPYSGEELDNHFNWLMESRVIHGNSLTKVKSYWVRFVHAISPSSYINDFFVIPKDDITNKQNKLNDSVLDLALHDHGLSKTYVAKELTSYLANKSFEGHDSKEMDLKNSSEMKLDEVTSARKGDIAIYNQFMRSSLHLTFMSKSHCYHLLVRFFNFLYQGQIASAGIILEQFKNLLVNDINLEQVFSMMESLKNDCHKEILNLQTFFTKFLTENSLPNQNINQQLNYSLDFLFNKIFFHPQSYFNYFQGKDSFSYKDQKYTFSMSDNDKGRLIKALGNIAMSEDKHGEISIKAKMIQLLYKRITNDDLKQLILANLKYVGLPNQIQEEFKKPFSQELSKALISRLQNQIEIDLELVSVVRSYLNTDTNKSYTEQIKASRNNLLKFKEFSSFFPGETPQIIYILPENEPIPNPQLEFECEEKHLRDKVLGAVMDEHNLNAALEEYGKLLNLKFQSTGERLPIWNLMCQTLRDKFEKNTINVISLEKTLERFHAKYIKVSSLSTSLSLMSISSSKDEIASSSLLNSNFN